MLPQNINNITEETLNLLVTNQVTESKIIEFKSTVQVSSNDEKKEFLADVSSFANTTGGDIIYGVTEINGVATAVPGFPVTDPDTEKLRLENLLTTGLSPRIDQIITSVRLASGNYVFIIRIRQSFISPHRVIINGHDKFYGRNSAGKYPLDTDQLRSAFLQSDSVIQKVKDLHAEHLLKIEADHTPYLLRSSKRIIIDIIPLESISSKVSINQRQVESLVMPNSTLLAPMFFGGGWTPNQINLEGWVSWSSMTEGAVRSYTQINRNATIEAVDSSCLEGDEKLRIDMVELEVFEQIKKGLEILQLLGVNTPVYIFVSLTGIKNYKIIRNQRHRQTDTIPIRQSRLDLPEIVLNGYEESIEPLIKPSFDLVWNACGLEKSDNFNDEGRFLLTG